MKLKSKTLPYLLSAALLLVIFSLQSCNYSFTGTNLSPDIKAITVRQFENYAGDGPATISQTFTESLRDLYQRNTRLNVINDGESDLQVEGEIIGYTTSPSTPSASGSSDRVDIASQTRLKITVKVVFINLTNEEEDFEKTFSNFRDFPSDKPLSSVESGLIDEIFEDITLDIFNATVANW